LTAEEYAALMSDNVEDIMELRLWSREKIKENKAKVARAYNKKVKPKEWNGLDRTRHLIPKTKLQSTALMIIHGSSIRR
jgi:hypothetical protein